MNRGDSMQSDDLPLIGLRVLEFTHMVMGPSAGLVLADLGADVTRIEPLGGDPTRQLTGSGAGYFAMYNRNKRSLCVNLKDPAGLAVARRIAGSADVVIENFRPGTLERLGLGYETLRAGNPGLVYCSAKGFLGGPFEKRVALDEVAQMMGGLAYMTGPPGRPLRAGASIIDVTGGLFGVIAILAALRRRDATGEGAHVKCSLFETTAFLVGQHIAQLAVTGQPAAPMPARVSAWAIYDVFEAAGGEQLFVAVVSDSQWRAFCEDFRFADFLADASLAGNNDRVAQRERILPIVRAAFARIAREELLTRLEAAGVAAAKIAKPEDLLADPHLNAAGGFVDVSLPNRTRARLPALPVEIDGARPGLRRDLSAPGADSRSILEEAGLSGAQIDALFRAGTIG